MSKSKVWVYFTNMSRSKVWVYFTNLSRIRLGCISLIFSKYTIMTKQWLTKPGFLKIVDKVCYCFDTTNSYRSQYSENQKIWKKETTLGLKALNSPINMRNSNCAV